MMSSYTSFVFCFVALFLQNLVFCDYYKNNEVTTFSPKRFYHELLKNQSSHIQLNHQNIPHITIELIWELSSAKTVEIEHSNVQDIEPGYSILLLGLQKLSLKHNLLEEIKKDVFSFTLIEELDLSYNQIRTIEDEAFSYLPMLHYINLKNNKLEVYKSNWFVNSSYVYSFNFENNLIKSISDTFTQNEGFVDNVDFILSHNRIEEISELALPKNWKFNKLYLDHNAITTIKNETFSRVSMGIKDLRLDHNQIVCTTVNITSVEKVKVDNNPWNEECLVAFWEQKNPKPTTSAPPVTSTYKTVTYGKFIRFG